MSISTRAQSSVGNRLLASLPADEYKTISSQLTPADLHRGEILFRPEEEVQRAYFPNTCVISLLADLEDGTGLEVGLVGYEGVVGISAILGGGETKVATVQGDGEALWMDANDLRAAFLRGGKMQSYLLNYTHALMSQISQTAVCNMRHYAEGRMARWLLLYQDRKLDDEFKLTHEFMANMLGVRRASVSEVASKLQQAGLINYDRGRIRILNRTGLVQITCECYTFVKEHFDQLYRH